MRRSSLTWRCCLPASVATRSVRLTDASRAGQPATSNTAGTPAISPATLAAMQLPTVSPIRYEAGETTLERQTRIRPSATPAIIIDGDFNKCARCQDHFMNRDKVWRLQRGHIFHAQCWDRVSRAHVDRQLAENMEGSATERGPCPICRGVGLITAEFHYALARDQESLDRHGDILRGANELRDLRGELNRATAMMTGNAVVSTTTPAGQPASSASAGL
eukprot:6681890-Pyramimonas_sp.AAC.1